MIALQLCCCMDYGERECRENSHHRDIPRCCSHRREIFGVKLIDGSARLRRDHLAGGSRDGRHAARRPSSRLRGRRELLPKFLAK